MSEAILFLLGAATGFPLGCSLMNTYWRRRLGKIENDVHALKREFAGGTAALLRAENERLRIDNQSMRRALARREQAGRPAGQEQAGRPESQQAR